MTQGQPDQDQDESTVVDVAPLPEEPDQDAVGESDAPAQASAETSEETGESSALAADGASRRGGRHEHLEHEGEVAADFLETLLDIADLDGDLEVNVEGDRAAVAIVDSEDGPAPKALVGRDGAVLEALQELTRLAVQAETGDRSRLMLDVAGHRAGRRAQLVELARTTIEQVRESGDRAELEPMSAFERKVVHDEVLAAGLVSESEGAEPQRYVVILPAG
nr:R3H domain-containing nucleic acid-binding protein [Ornithinimicrobium sp. F0845]